RLLQSRGDEPAVLLQHSDPSEPGAEPRWLWFSQPRKILTAQRLADVMDVLAAAEAEVRAGRWVAGFLTYEAGPALDPALSAHDGGPLPLTWWGVFEAPREVQLEIEASTSVSPAHPSPAVWQPILTRGDYRSALRSIHRHIASGNTYQVNYTFPLETPWGEDPATLFTGLAAAQRCRYSAYLDTGRFVVCSASPELFFSLDGQRIVTRPMKGTARRGRFPAEDDERAEALRTSEKERAENLMIVDMMRNDLGKIAGPGTVEVDDLFTVETYPTVHQLTSTVAGRTKSGIVEILQALFPSASITGAPKVATAQLIRQLEPRPRGLYTGAIGFFAPQRLAQLNVAIRTATVDRERGVATYGTGGGIVWDSEADAEYEECRAKALVLGRSSPRFELLETFLWRPRSGYFLLERHLDRLLASARYFGIDLRRDVVLRHLDSVAGRLEPVRHRIRLVIYRDATVEVTAKPWACSGRTEWRITPDDRPIDDEDPFLFHKTTHRRVYDEALQRHPEFDEVVLWNARGELTESTRANLVLSINGRWLTPPVHCGLLAGTYRAELLARGRVREEVLPLAALATAQDVFLVNSVRGWIRVDRQGIRPTRLTEHRSTRI
ncbi:MAG: aminodeoxychorismate synthase component I, partial [Acidobacteriota bacterium]